MWDKFVNNLIFWKKTDGEEGQPVTCGTPKTAKSSLKFPAFLRMYKNQNSAQSWAAEDMLDFDDVISRMRDYAEPVYLEYQEVNNDFAFSIIKADFFQYLFWNNYLWVLYLPADEENDLPATFSLYDATKNDEGEFDGKEFYNLITHKMDTILFPQFLIKVMWDGQQASDRLNRWYKLAYTMTLNEHLFNSRLLLGHKYLKTSYSGTTNTTKRNIENDRNLLYNLSPTMNIHRETEDLKSEPREINLVFAQEAHGWLSASYFYLDRELAELGRVANINHKGERMTAGENYKDIYAIKNRQAAVLDQLNLFAENLKMKYGQFAPDLLFDLRFKEPTTPEPEDTIEEPEGPEENKENE